MSCVAQIKILEIHQKEIFPGEISVTISGCESGFWCWTQSQVTTSHHSCVLVEHSFPCTNGKSTEEQKKIQKVILLKVSLLKGYPIT